MSHLIHPRDILIYLSKADLLLTYKTAILFVSTFWFHGRTSHNRKISQSDDKVEVIKNLAAPFMSDLLIVPPKYTLVKWPFMSPHCCMEFANIIRWTHGRASITSLDYS